MSHVRWCITVSDETDKALRAYLAKKGRKKDDISKFVDEAVCTRLFEITVSNLKERNRIYSQKTVRKAIEEALEAV